jgi:hypothetical protein
MRVVGDGPYGGRDVVVVVVVVLVVVMVLIVRIISNADVSVCRFCCWCYYVQ